MSEIETIQLQIGQSEHGKSRMELLKKAYEMGDENNDYYNSMKYRLEYMEEALFYDDDLLIFIIFPEILKMHDNHIREYGYDKFTYDIMWGYKWMLDSIEKYYQISLEKFEEYMSDFKSRCEKNGYSLRKYYQIKMEMYQRIDLKKTREAYEMMKRCQRDELCDC